MLNFGKNIKYDQNTVLVKMFSLNHRNFITKMHSWTLDVVVI